MTTPPAQAKSSLSEYTTEEVDAVVTVRCQELAELLGWELTPPKALVTAPDALTEAMNSDVCLRSVRYRTTPRHEGLMSMFATWASHTFGPSLLGYFATTPNTLYLSSELVPAQGGYVLMHELTHAAQWQKYPDLFDAIDAARVRAEDLIDQQGDDSEASRVARDRYESLVTFIEGHATLNGRRACEKRLVRDNPEVSPAEANAFITTTMCLDLEDETTQLNYVRGEKMVAALEPSQWDSMARDPEAIVRLFTRIKP